MAVFIGGVLALPLVTPVFGSEGLIIIHNHHISGVLPIKTWKAIRDARIVKQELDYSCGAASLATLLNEFYGKSIGEAELLDAMDKGEMRASFEDMQRALPQFGFRAIGYAVSYDQLAKLKVPVIVYLKHRRGDHFSVLRGINESTVWLADPSLGNRTYSRSQFVVMWKAWGKEQGGGELKGRILAVLPAGSAYKSVDFFSKAPSRQTAQAVEQLSVRFVP